MLKHNITAARLRELLWYDPDTGLFTWRIQPNGRVKAGSVAGNINPGGYVGIGVDRGLYLAHRLAWLYVTGEWPQGHVDHFDGDTTNNRWLNLRDVNAFTNQQNQRRARADNKAKLLGVSTKHNGFQASICANGKTHYLGFFKTAEAAHAAYLSAKQRLHDGSFIAAETTEETA